MFLFRKIRSNFIFLFVLTAALPAFCLGALLLDRTFGMMRDAIVRENQQIVNQVLQLIETRFDEMKRDLERLAADTSVRTLRPEAMYPKLRLFFQFIPVYYNIHLYDRAGTLRNVEYYTAFNDKLDGVGRANLADAPAAVRACLTGAMEEKRSVVSDFILNSSGEKIVLVASPVFEFGGSDRVVGVLSAAVKIEDIYFHRLLESVRLDAGRYVAITDYAGGILSQAGSLPVDLYRFDFPAGAPYLGENDADYDGIALVHGRKDFISCRGLRQLYGNLITGRPYRAAFAPAASLLEIVVWGVFFTLVLFSLAATTLGTTLSAPIQRLSDGLRKLREGELGTRLPEASDDELGATAAAFNELAENLHRNSVIEAIWRSRGA